MVPKNIIRKNVTNFIYSLCSKVGKESSTKNKQIDKDFVAIYDGPNDQSTKIKELKGDLGNFTITSSGNFLFVKLKSDDLSDGNLGFLATIHYSNPYLNM